MTKDIFIKSLEELTNYIKKISDEATIYIILWRIDSNAFKKFMEQCDVANEMLDKLKPYYFDYDNDALLLVKKELLETSYELMITTFNKLHEIYFGYAPGEDTSSNNEYKFGYVVLEYGITRVFNCKANNLDKAFGIFGKEMERQYGLDAPDKLVLVEVRENGIEVDW